VPTILIIFQKVNWPNFKLSCQAICVRPNICWIWGGGGSAPSKYAPDLKPKFTSYLVQIRVGPIVMEKLSSWILKFCKEMLQQTWDEVVYFYLRFLRFFCSSEKLLQKVQLSHRRRVLLRVIEIQYFAKSLEGHWRSLEMEPFDKSHRSSYWRSIVSMTLSCHCRDKTRKWSKNRNFFHTPHAFDIRRPVVRVPVEILPERFGTEN